jgi:hypothetical protein
MKGRKKSRAMGICYYCLNPLEADQPGGLNPRHVYNQVPYGECRQAQIVKGWPVERHGEEMFVGEEYTLKNQDYSTEHLNYSPEEKHTMIDDFIRRLEAEGPKDDEPIVLKDGRIVPAKHDHDDETTKGKRHGKTVRSPKKNQSGD